MQIHPEFPEAHDSKRAYYRARGLAGLLGIPDAEAADYSLKARLAVIRKLQAARRAEIARGRAKSWLYDINRHLSLCAALRAEYEALCDFIGEPGGGEGSSAGGAK